jgi:ubiquinone/menaquinone biosynthesis C-methylase UbiE
MRTFANDFHLTPETRILDVGGTAGNWRLLSFRPKVTLLNLPSPTGGGGVEDFAHVIGDACNLPFEDKSFPVAFSNSTIEHVGTFERQRQFANEIRRVATSYYVQTPNRWFFMEPHYLTPFVHWLPKRIRRRIVRYGTVWGLVAKPSPLMRDEKLDELRLLTATEFEQLFPDAEIKRERFLGMTKSFIAMRRPQ